MVFVLQRWSCAWLREQPYRLRYYLYPCRTVVHLLLLRNCPSTHAGPAECSTRITRTDIGRAHTSLYLRLRDLDSTQRRDEFTTRPWSGAMPSALAHYHEGSGSPPPPNSKSAAKIQNRRQAFDAEDRGRGVALMVCWPRDRCACLCPSPRHLARRDAARDECCLRVVPPAISTSP